MEIQTFIHNHNYKEIPEIFSKEQIKLIFAKFKEKCLMSNCPINRWLNLRNLTLLAINYLLALRPNEAVSIKVSNINFSNNTVYIEGISNKTHKGRVLPLTDELLSYLKDYILFTERHFSIVSDYLFPSLEGNHISRDHWSEIFRDTLKETEIYKIPVRGKHGHYSLYTLRHTRATELLILTGRIDYVSNFLGHKDWDSTQIYIHLSNLYGSNSYLEYMKCVLSNDALSNHRER